jgi:hypothetical protein
MIYWAPAKLRMRLKRQSTAWGEIVLNHKSDKELVSRLYKEFSSFNSKKFFEMHKVFEWTRHQITQMTKRHMKTCRTLLGKHG